MNIIEQLKREKFGWVLYDVQQLIFRGQVFFDMPVGGPALSLGMDGKSEHRTLADTNITKSRSIGEENEMFVARAMEWEINRWSGGVDGAITFFAAGSAYAQMSMKMGSAGRFEFSKELTLLPGVKFYALVQCNESSSMMLQRRPELIVRLVGEMTRKIREVERGEL